MSRLGQTLRLCTIRTSEGRTNYLKKKGVFGAIGDNCRIQDRKVPLYARLIKLGNNVKVASNVTFITHDVTHAMLNDNKIFANKMFQEKIGCIEIHDNVFVGAGSTILYDVEIGSNVIIGAGSLVNKDVPSNSVVAGVPARVICTFDEYIKRRDKEVGYPEDILPRGELVDEKSSKWFWDEFYRKHKKE